ncbi:myb domain-containing protein, partial [Reticulomyxa filosa]
MTTTYNSQVLSTKERKKQVRVYIILCNNKQWGGGQATLETIEKQLLDQYTARLGQVKEIRTGLQALLSDLEKDDVSVKKVLSVDNKMMKQKMIEEEKNKFKELTDRLEALKNQRTDEMKNDTKETTVTTITATAEIGANKEKTNETTATTTTTTSNAGVTVDTASNANAENVNSNKGNEIEINKQFTMPPPVEIPSLEVANVPPLRERLHVEPFLRSELPQQHLVQINTELEPFGQENKSEDVVTDEDELSGHSDTELDQGIITVSEVETEDEEEDTDTEEIEAQSEELKKIQAEET